MARLSPRNWQILVGLIFVVGGLSFFGYSYSLRGKSYAREAPESMLQIETTNYRQRRRGMRSIFGEQLGLVFVGLGAVAIVHAFKDKSFRKSAEANEEAW